MVRPVTGMPHPSRQCRRKHSHRAVSYGNIANRSDSGGRTTCRITWPPSQNRPPVNRKTGARAGPKRRG